MVIKIGNEAMCRVLEFIADGKADRRVYCVIMGTPE